MNRAMQLFSRGPQTFELQVHDMTLRVSAPLDYSDEVRASVLQFWEQFQSYSARHPEVRSSKTPIHVPDDAPETVREVVRIASAGGVGPIFAVRGVVVDHAGRFIGADTPVVTVSSEGDHFVQVRERQRFVVVRSEDGENDVSIVIDPSHGPVGLHTATPSDGIGDADGLAIIGRSTAEASVCAAAVLALLRKSGPKSMPAALRHVATAPGVLGGVIVQGELIAVTGAVELAS